MAANLVGQMKLGVWTAMYWELAPEDAIRHLAHLGFRHVDLAAEHLGEIAAAGSDRIERFAALAADLGVNVWQTHTAFGLDPTHDDPAQRSEHARFLADQIRQSAALGASNVVVHPGTAGSPDSPEDRHRTVDRNVEFIRVAAEAAGQAGLRLAVENMGPESFGRRIEELHEIIDAVGSPHLGICLDTGHANRSRLDVPRAVRQCGSRLVCTHLNDNDGTADQHRLPGCGSLDWFAIMQALRDIDYTGPLCFEIPGENKCPIAIRDVKLQFLAHVMEFVSAPAHANHGLAVRGEPAKEFMKRGWLRPDAFDA